MQSTLVKLDAMKLVGITARTNNRSEADWIQGKIFPCVQQYFQQHMFEKILHRKNPGRTLCMYTEYESDHTGDYTYFIGEEVEVIGELSQEFKSLIVPPQHYTKFTTDAGVMPDVLKNAWFDIWEMTPQDLGGVRRYHSDFEVYDERAADHQNIVLDIYIGIMDNNHC